MYYRRRFYNDWHHSDLLLNIVAPGGITFPFNGALVEVHCLRVDGPNHWVALHLPCWLSGQEADAAAIVGGDSCWVRVVAVLCQAGQSPQGYTFRTEDLSVWAAAQQPLCKLYTASDVQQSLVQLRPLQVELVPVGQRRWTMCTQWERFLCCKVGLFTY